MAIDPEKLSTPKTLGDFAFALKRHLPKRLNELRSLGKQTRSLTRSKRRG